jgi:hypothetical protein
MNLLDSYKQFKSDIENKKLFDDYAKSKWNDPKELSQDVIEMASEDIEDDFNVTLYEEQIKFILFSSSSIAWQDRNENSIYGGFLINGLWESLVLESEFWKIDFSLAPDAEIPDKLKHFEKLNWFEKQSWGDDWRYGCFIREKGVFPPKIAFFDKNWFTPMDLSLDEYFDAMFASCAVCGWQYFYIDYNQELPHLNKAIEDMENAVNLLPKLFPDKDFSYHENKLNELKKIKNL